MIMIFTTLRTENKLFNMNKVNIKAALLLVILGSVICEENKTYTNKYDNMNLDEILTSERLLTGYVNCLLDVGPCTPDGKELKANLPEAIGNDCHKCTERQKAGSDQVMEYIIDHRPDDWAKLEQRYNPDGSYKMKYLLRHKTDEDKNKIENDYITTKSDENDD